MSSLSNVISICDCPLSDSIFDIKNALEEPTICRVRKIFAVRYCEPGKEEPTKKHVFIWVQWINTNASCMFTARLMHQGEKDLFKLDRWDSPICTAVDKYGNAIAHAHWVVRLSSREKFLEAELLYGIRSDEQMWSKFISLGESEEVSDDEQEQLKEVDEAEPSQQTDVQEKTEEVPKLALPIPKLRRERADTNIPEHSKLSLLLPDFEDNDEPPELDLAEWNEIFGFEIPTHEENIVFASHSSQLTRKELHQLSRGTIKCYGDLPPEFLPMEK